MFKNTKKEDQQIPKKFQEILSVEEAKELRDRKFRDIPDYGETKEQIFKAINKYVNSDSVSQFIFMIKRETMYFRYIHMHRQKQKKRAMSLKEMTEAAFQSTSRSKHFLGKSTKNSSWIFL